MGTPRPWAAPIPSSPPFMPGRLRGRRDGPCMSILLGERPGSVPFRTRSADELEARLSSLSAAFKIPCRGRIGPALPRRAVHLGGGAAGTSIGGIVQTPHLRACAVEIRRRRATRRRSCKPPSGSSSLRSVRRVLVGTLSPAVGPDPFPHSHAAQNCESCSDRPHPAPTRGQAQREKSWRLRDSLRRQAGRAASSARSSRWSVSSAHLGGRARALALALWGAPPRLYRRCRADWIPRRPQTYTPIRPSSYSRSAQPSRRFVLLRPRPRQSGGLRAGGTGASTRSSRDGAAARAPFWGRRPAAAPFSWSTGKIAMSMCRSPFFVQAGRAFLVKPCFLAPASRGFSAHRLRLPRGVVRRRAQLPGPAPPIPRNLPRSSAFFRTRPCAHRGEIPGVRRGRRRAERPFPFRRLAPPTATFPKSRAGAARPGRADHRRNKKGRGGSRRLFRALPHPALRGAASSNDRETDGREGAPLPLSTTTSPGLRLWPPNRVSHRPGASNVIGDGRRDGDRACRWGFHNQLSGRNRRLLRHLRALTTQVPLVAGLTLVVRDLIPPRAGPRPLAVTRLRTSPLL